MIVLGVLLTFGTAVFVAAEFSFVALDQASVKRRQERGEKGLGPVLHALKTLSTQLSGAQVGITLTTILLGYTTQVALTTILADALGNAGLALAASVAAATVTAAVLVNVFSMLFGELVPKNMALADPLKTARLTAPLQLAFTWAFYPIIKMLNGAANGLLRMVGIEPVEELSSARSASELAALVSHSAEAGTLEADTASLFTRSVAIKDLQAVDVMTDRGEMVVLPFDASVQDVIDVAKESGFSRFPIADEDGEGFTGLASLRHAASIPFSRRDLVPAAAKPVGVSAPSVPETLGLTPLLEELRSGAQMAFVIDEFGHTSGIVTLEDVVEELIGDVSDEHDRRRLGIKPSPRGGFMVPGTLRPDELATQTGLIVSEDGPYETLAGLLMTELGAIPNVEDTIIHKGVQLQVAAMKGRRVTRIWVSTVEDDDPDPNRSASRASSEEGGS